jgi:hypothetical protein
MPVVMAAGTPWLALTPNAVLILFSLLAMLWHPTQVGYRAWPLRALPNAKTLCELAKAAMNNANRIHLDSATKLCAFSCLMNLS